MSSDPTPRTNRPGNDSADPNEDPQQDDAIIGRAVRWSAVLLVIVGAAVALLFLIFRKTPEATPEQVTEITAPVTRDTRPAEIPSVSFTDITRSAGIEFRHNNGAVGDKLLPETMGGGAAFLDYDNDGNQDILFVNGNWWPEQLAQGKQPTTQALYRNEGNGTFSNRTVGSGLDTDFYGMGAAVGDFDNDGWVDVYLTAVGENRLFRNLGDGRFADVTADAGVGGSASEWSTGAGWFDYDNDGDLDLFVGNYVRWSREIDFEVGYTLVGVGRAYGPPMNFSGTHPYLFRNDGNAKFTDVSAEAGVQVRNRATGSPMAKSMAIALVDLDADGWMDVIVANDTVQNFVFHNHRDGTFKEIGALTGIAFDSYGKARGAMGIDTAHFRGDNAIGIGIGNFANEMTALYVSQGNPLMFEDEAITEGVGPASRLLLKFGFLFLDYDLDGREDILTANGHLEEEIHQVQASQQYRQPAQLFWNAGRDQSAGFIVVPAEKAGGELFEPIVGRGSAFADVDNDGDLDVLLLQTGDRPLLLRNDQKTGNRWARVKLIGTDANRDAIGAIVRARIDDRTLTRQVMPTRSYLSQSELAIALGLGDSDQIDAMTITWPGSSKAVNVPPPIPGQITVIKQADAPVRDPG